MFELKTEIVSRSILLGKAFASSYAKSPGSDETARLFEAYKTERRKLDFEGNGKRPCSRTAYDATQGNL